MTIKKEVTELVKPIVVHEAKSAFYKGKLVAVVSGKSTLFVLKKVKNGAKFTAAYFKELRKK